MTIATPTRTIAASSGRTRFNKRGLPYIGAEVCRDLVSALADAPANLEGLGLRVKRCIKLRASTSLLRAGQLPAENPECLDHEVDIGLGQAKTDAQT